MPNPRPPRISVPLNDIQEEFRAQLQFLKSSCDAFDTGNRDEFRRIALAIRVLLHDQGQSHSVAVQLGIKNAKFMAFGGPIDRTNLLPEWPLAIVQMAAGEATYMPALAESGYSMRLLDFDDWWTEVVFKSDAIEMSRSGFVLNIANQAGGAHVDSAIGEDYHKISKQNAAGLVFSSSGSPMKDIDDVEKAYLRHIGFEVLQTLEPEWNKIRGNRFCECGSGRKNRYCCGK